jgi:hypothetical protein
MLNTSPCQLTNEVAWIDGVGKELRVGPANVGKPGPGEVLVKNFAVVINPIDWATSLKTLCTLAQILYLSRILAGPIYSLWSLKISFCVFYCFVVTLIF